MRCKGVLPGKGVGGGRRRYRCPDACTLRKGAGEPCRRICHNSTSQRAMGSFAVTLRTGRATAPAVTGAVSSVGQSRGLIIPWSLVRAQHGLPFSSCFSGLAAPAKFAADLVAQPKPGAGEPLQKSCGSWHMQKPCDPFASMPGQSGTLPFAARPNPAAGLIVAGACCGDTAAPVPPCAVRSGGGSKSSSSSKPQRAGRFCCLQG